MTCQLNFFSATSTSRCLCKQKIYFMIFKYLGSAIVFANYFPQNVLGHNFNIDTIV